MSNYGNHDLDNKMKKIMGLFFVTVLFFICLWGAWVNYNLPLVTIEVKEAEIYQDEEIPVFQVHASFNKTKNIVLSKDYTIQNLIWEINRGEGYELLHNINPVYEGKYPVNVVLTDELKEKLGEDWSSKLRFEIKEGSFHVKNKFGNWEENRFKRMEGAYVVEEFLVLNEGTYYFDKEGNKVTGKQEILGNTYYFDEQGKFDEEKNRINPAKPMIALTFDDGPGKYTDELLDALEKYDARATFFMLGENVEKYPETVAHMKEIGCEIGNHTTNHKNLTKLEADDAVSQIEKTNDLIRIIIEEGAGVVRPPYGAFNDEVKEIVDYPLILWNVDTLDWEMKNAEKVKNYTLDTAKDGDIVLMHDIYESTVDATIAMIPELLERGYQLVTVSEMAQAHGIKMEEGKIYHKF